MNDHAFERRADEALTSLNRGLTAAAEDHDFDSDFNAGALIVEFEDPPARFVVSPDSPVRQIWVSANVKSFKLDWDEARNQFILAGTGQTLAELMSEAISVHLGEKVAL